MPAALPQWYTVALPHSDIREGRLDESVFAANIWAVRQNHAPTTYLDPEQFFAKTYLTGGLSKILKKAGKALCGTTEAGDRIVSLQTAFGGGKTHTQVALWHLARHPDVLRSSASCAEVREALGDLIPKEPCNVAVFTSQTCDATQGRRTPEGIRTRTLWGELALQLGGADLYRLIEANDQSRAVPQGLFVEILRQAAPCLILLDELADYCVGAMAVPVGHGTLADQTVSFVQQLTESAAQAPGAVIVATLPASHLEVASSDKGQEILSRLEKRFGRMSADLKPVADEEVNEVVRRRLFEKLGEPAAHAQVADVFLKLYQAHKNEVPQEASKAAYRDRILSAYPFHPSLIDTLYLRWGSHNDFQRTRGVLRLLASLVGDLWQQRETTRQTQPLIQPCHVRWTIDALRAALTRLWGATYDSVVAADVIGDKANAVAVDEERGREYADERVAQGVAAAVLLGSFGGQGERAGFSSKEIRLSAGRPDLNWGYADGALLALEEKAFYLHNAAAGSQGKRYWFGTKPTLTKLLVQYRGQFTGQDFDAEIIETLQTQTKGLKTDPAPWKVLVNPQADLPEQKVLTLLIMPPDCVWGDDSIFGGSRGRVKELSERWGSKDRLYRNTLLFLLPNQRGLNRIRKELRGIAALEAVKRDYASQLDPDQLGELKQKLTRQKEAVAEVIGAAYPHLARVDGREVAASNMTEIGNNLTDHLLAAWRQVTDEEEWVLRKVGPVTLQKTGMVPTEGGVRVRDAVEAFLRYTDKPMVSSTDAVLPGLSQSCKDRVIGIGRGTSPEKLQTKRCGEYVALDRGEEGVWIIPPFAEKPDDTEGKPTGGGGSSLPPLPNTDKPIRKPGTTGGEEETPAPPTVRAVAIEGSVALENWTEVFRCFIVPASRLTLTCLVMAACVPAGCARWNHLLQPEVTEPAVRERITVSPDTAHALDRTVADPRGPVVSAREAHPAPAEPAGPADVPVFSLPDAVAFALKNNPRLRAARASVARARGQEQVAFAPFLPEANLLVRYGGTSPNLSPGAPGPVGGILPSGTGPHGFAQAELQLQWTVWDFGRTAGRYGQAVSREHIAERQLARASQTVAYDVTSAYLRLLLAQAARRVQDQSIRLARAILDDTRVRREAGVADPDTVLRAEVQLSEAREALVLAAQAEFDALARLNQAMGRNVSLPLQLIDWTARPAFDRSLPECLQAAVAGRQEVAVAREAVAAAGHGLQAAEGEFFPHLYLVGSLGRVDGEGVLNGWHEGAAIHLNQLLYGGGRRQGERRAAEAEVRAAAANAQVVFDNVSLEVNLAFRALAAARARIRLAETAVVQARENLRLVRVKYNNGNATPTDLVDAETALTRSEQRDYSAGYDYLAALAQLEYAVGAPQGCFLGQPPAPARDAARPEQLPPPRPFPAGGKQGE
jgi:outer membrane protein TolC